MSGSLFLKGVEFMIKKLIVSIVVVLSLVLSFPFVSSAQIKENSFELHTLDSVSSFFNDSILQTYQNHITSFDDDEKISSIYDAINSFSLTGYKPMLYGYSYNGGTLHLFVYAISEIVTDVSYFSYGDVSQYDSVSGIIQLAYDNTANMPYGYIIIGQPCEYNFSTHVWNYSSTYTTTLYGYTDGRKAIGYIGSSNYGFALLDANCSVFSAYQYENNGGSNLNTSSDLFAIDSSGLTDFMSDDLSYTNSDGNIITPTPIPNSLDKSVAFRKIDLSTIYSYTAKAHCAGLLAWELDPVGYSIIDENLSGWTMHYNILVTYKWDTSMDNVVFRPFYNGGSASGTVAWDIDIEPTGSIKANEQKFDIYDLLNTYQVSQGSSTDIANLGLAVYALKNGKGSVLGDFFGQLGQDITDISSQIGQANLFSINGYSANDISQIFTPTYTYALTHLDMQVVAYPVNNTAHIKGKSGTTKLNLVTNTNSAYAQGAEVTDSESGYDIVSPDYESSGDTVVTPVNNGSGSQVYVVINNPSSNSTGGGSSSSSSSSPSINIDNGGTISFDPGYRDLRNDVISSENDWGQYFLPFKDTNGVGEMFGSFLDNMPDELKAIFIGGFGILTCFAIYRFIRRG